MKVGDLFEMFDTECEEESSCDRVFLVVLILCVLCFACGGTCNCESDRCNSRYCGGGDWGPLMLVIVVFLLFNNGCWGRNGENEVLNVDDQC